MADSETRDSYHHGNLAEALISAAIELVEERGFEQLSLREVAKRVGVSPGAPFRHFKTKAALVTAMAEQAMVRFRAAVDQAVASAQSDDPILGLEAIGRGYVSWALNNPTHFRIISSRSLVDFSNSPQLQADNDAVRELMIEFIIRGQSSGRISPDLSVDAILLSSRALAYGLARMWSDGHFREWHVKDDPESAMHSSLNMFIRSLESR